MLSALSAGDFGVRFSLDGEQQVQRDDDAAAEWSDPRSSMRWLAFSAKG